MPALRRAVSEVGSHRGPAAKATQAGKNLYIVIPNLTAPEREFLEGFARGIRPLDPGFIRQYARDPVAFVHDFIVFTLPAPNDRPTEYQDRILDALIEYNRVAVRGPHALGKTALAAWLVLWGVLTADDVKVVTTASSWLQLTTFLWPEIRKWAGMLNWAKLGRPPFTRFELLARSLRLSATREAFAVSPSDPAKMEGAHAERIVYIYDEAKSIPVGNFDASEGAFAGAGKDTGREAYALAISTPGAASGRFYDIHTQRRGLEDWEAIHVTIDEVIAAGRVSKDWVKRMAKSWGREDPRFIRRVLGDFVDSDIESVVIPTSWIELAFERFREWEAAGSKTIGDPIALGVDVGRGGDRSVIAPRYQCLIPGAKDLRDEDGEPIYGQVITELFTHKKRDTMNFAGIVAKRMGEDTIAIVDVIGTGAGVVDRVRELDHRVFSFNASKKTKRRDATGTNGFFNTRSAAWWGLRDLLNPDNDHWIAIPEFEDGYSSVQSELTAPDWWETSSGDIRVRGKPEIKEELGVSTDLADALIQAFWVGTFGALMV